jgi:hypothetical protein
MSEPGYPLDKDTLVNLKRVMLPREPPDSDWKHGDKLVAATVHKYLERSSTLEEFIQKLGDDEMTTSNSFERLVLTVVRAKAEGYLEMLKQNR